MHFYITKVDLSFYSIGLQHTVEFRFITELFFRLIVFIFLTKYNSSHISQLLVLYISTTLLCASLNR